MIDFSKSFLLGRRGVGQKESPFWSTECSCVVSTRDERFITVFALESFFIFDRRDNKADNLCLRFRSDLRDLGRMTFCFGSRRGRFFPRLGLLFRAGRSSGCSSGRFLFGLEELEGVVR